MEFMNRGLSHNQERDRNREVRYPPVYSALAEISPGMRGGRLASRMNSRDQGQVQRRGSGFRI